MHGNQSGKQRFARRWSFLFLPAGLGLLLWFCYGHTLDAPFIFDDWRHIEGNPHIRLTELNPSSLCRAALESPLPHRPVANISLALNYYFHGYQVAGYHLFNILIHLLNGLLLFEFLRLTLNLPAIRGRQGPPGLLPHAASLVWLVHPLHIQSVTYIVQRMNSLAVLFILLALFCYAKGRLAAGRLSKVLLWTLSLSAFLLGLGSKEITAALPFFILLYEWFFFQDASSHRLRRLLPATGAVLLLSAITAFVFLGPDLADRIHASYRLRDFTMSQRLLTEPRVVVFYLTQLLYPHPSRLNLDHDFPLSISLLTPPPTLPAIIILAVLFGAGLLCIRRNRFLAFAVFWWFGSLAMESSIIGLEIIFEHRTYFPSLLAVPAVLMALCAVLRPRPARIFFLITTVLLFSFWTHERNTVWLDEVTLRLDSAAKSPEKPRTHAILANALVRQGRLAEAAEQYRTALALSPANAEEIHYNLGNLLLRTGRPEQAARHYRAALNLDPGLGVARLNLGMALERQGRYHEAAAQYRELLRRSPGEARGYNNLGRLLLREKRLEEAADLFREAVRLRPGYTRARRNLEITSRLLRKQ